MVRAMIDKKNLYKITGIAFFISNMIMLILTFLQTYNVNYNSNYANTNIIISTNIGFLLLSISIGLAIYLILYYFNILPNTIKSIE